MGDERRPGRRAPGWRARVGTVRVRTTVLATAVVGLALVVGSVGSVWALRRSLTDGLRSSAQLRADDVAASLRSGTPATALPLDGDDEVLVQVVDGGGQVVAASPNVSTRAAVARLAPGATRRVDGVPVTDIEEEGDGPATVGQEKEDFVVAARASNSGTDPVTVLVGRSLEPVAESTRALTRILLTGVPLLLLVVAATTWVVVGRALAPVERMRREVAVISATSLDRRVPDPAGGDEIARLAHTLNAMLDRLEQAQRRQQRFVSDASHELRSPVAAIRQHAEVARAHPEGGDVGELAAEVLAESERLQRLVEDLLVVTRADEGTLGLTRREVDLDDLVLDEARRLRATTPLRIDTSGVAAGRVLGDPALLGRALRNVGDNARRHATSTVSFGLDPGADGNVWLTVDDDGPGVPTDQRARVFERFVRLDEARARDRGGSGLGLAIVAEIVAAHRGTVAVVDSPLGGARFEIRLPTSERPARRWEAERRGRAD